MPFENSLHEVKILLVDDEEILVWSIETELKKLGAEIQKCHTAQSARETFPRFMPDLVICDLRLPDGDGMDLLKEWRMQNQAVPVLLMTAHGGVDSAINAVRLNAFDYLQKPFDMKDLVHAVRRASEISKLRQKVSRMEGAVKGHVPVNIVGKTPCMQDLRRKLARVSASKTDTVLINGETGSGKELAARAIHEWSGLGEKPYIEVNCASIPENLLESELFGYERGAFTDARARKLGLFEIAGDGTIFLDEIGDMPLKLQAKLLRALEYRRFKRLGGIKDIEFSARIVAATNRRLIDEVAAQRFRADLYYRLNVIPIQIPPLRERKPDIEVLVHFFVEKICRDLQVPQPEVSESAMKCFKQHSWPGNVRELRNVLHRAIVLEAPSVLSPEHLDIDLPNNGSTISQIRSENQEFLEKENGRFTLPPDGISLEDLERELLNQALVRSHYNQSRAADLLHISRHTLRYRLEKHGLLSK